MKYLRRFCSEQVQLLLERMDTQWADEFAIGGSKWEPMLPYGKAFERFTRVEQLCIRNTARKQTTQFRKEQAYVGILERTMSTAKTKWDFDRERSGEKHWAESAGVSAQPAQMLTTAAMRQQMESLLNKSFTEEYAKHRQIHQQEQLARYAYGYSDAYGTCLQEVK